MLALYTLGIGSIPNFAVSHTSTLWLFTEVLQWEDVTPGQHGTLGDGVSVSSLSVFRLLGLHAGLSQALTCGAGLPLSKALAMRPNNLKCIIAKIDFCGGKNTAARV